jgi:hypothetical protein
MDTQVVREKYLERFLKPKGLITSMLDFPSVCNRTGIYYIALNDDE